MSIRFRLPIRLCLPLVLAAAPAFSSANTPDVITIRAEGYAEGIGLTARAAAVSAAQEEALVQAIESLAPNTGLGPFEEMLDRTLHYVARYDTLRCDRLGEETRAELDVMLFEARLRNDVAAAMLHKFTNPPRVLLVMGEQFARDDIPAVIPGAAAERELLEGLREVGLGALGVEAVSEDLDLLELAGIVQGGAAGGRTLARRHDFDVVMVGNARISQETGEAGGNADRHTATLRVDVFRGFDGKMCDQLVETAAVRSTYAQEAAEQVIEDACAKLVEPLSVAAVLTALAARADDHVFLTVRNAPSEACLEGVVSRAAGYPTAKGVEALFTAPDEARYLVHYTGAIVPFADYLAETAYCGREFEQVHVLRRHMELVFPAAP